MLVCICKEAADQYAIGERLFMALSQRKTDKVNLDSILNYDKETKDILILEDDLMSLIQLVSPHHPKRHIRLI